MFKKCLSTKKDSKAPMEHFLKKICKKINLEELKTDRIVGKPIKTYNRTIYPIVEILTVGNKIQSFKGAQISPIALMVEENNERYVISLTGEEINLEELIKLKEKTK